jgi:hypothetical protein
MGDKNGREEHAIDEKTPDLTYSLSYKDVVDILEIIDAVTGSELEVELGDLRMSVVKKGCAG